MVGLRVAVMRGGLEGGPLWGRALLEERGSWGGEHGGGGSSPRDTQEQDRGEEPAHVDPNKAVAATAAPKGS
jgi:hypothetical protein